MGLVPVISGCTVAFAQARALGWEEAMEAHGVCWAEARISTLPAALSSEACCDKTDVSEPGVAREPKMSSVSIYL